jgi:secreted trypsin-like serine protease
VLTAGHCFYESGQPHTNPSELEIRFGDSNLNSPGIKVQRANAVVIHPQYQPGGRPVNDIALVRIEGYILERAIRLDEDSNPVGDAVVSGWGRTGYGSATSNVLMKATLTLVPTELCNDADHYNGAIKSGMLCAGSDQGGMGSCAGDSGGPLVQVRDGQRYQIGVVSWGPTLCDTSTAHSVFTRVSAYVGWINGVIRNNSDQAEPDPNDCYRPRSNVPSYDCSMGEQDRLYRR